MKQSEFLEIIELNKGKHRQPIEVLVLGRNGILRDPIPVIIATDDTNLPLMNIARTYGWIKQDATEFYESEAKNVTNITEGITNTFVNTHTQETLDTEYGTFTLDLWYDKDENKWYDITELFGGDFSLLNISFQIIYPIKSQDGETASLYSEGIDWTNIEHFDEFKYFTSVTSIDNYAFENCSSLTSIIIPNSIISVGESAFRDCSSLTSITIPNSVTNVGNNAFNGCTNLISCTIGNSVASIGDGAFNGCSNLTNIMIPDNVTNIGENAFNGCNSLPIIDNIRYADTYVVEAVDKTLTEYTIKSGTKWIGDHAFYNCNSLVSITIPNSVTSIGDGAFSDCTNLTSITIPDSVISIGSSSFNYCNSLTNVIIPNSITSIDIYTFYHCINLTNVTIPNSVTSINSNAFAYCESLTSITIPNSVIDIQKDAFTFCKGLISIIVESGNTKYDSRNNSNAIIETNTNTLILGCKNTIIPDSVISIGEKAFYYCNGMTSITIPNSVTSIGVDAFSYCDLTSVNIGNSVTYIGDWAFAICSGLTSVTISSSVTSIGEYAFYNCSALTSIICNAINAPIIRNNTFQNIKTGGILTVPAGSTQYGGWMSASNYYLGKYNWTKVEQ